METEYNEHEKLRNAQTWKMQKKKKKKKKKTKINVQ